MGTNQLFYGTRWEIQDALFKLTQEAEALFQPAETGNDGQFITVNTGFLTEEIQGKLAENHKQQDALKKLLADFQENQIS